MVLHRQRRSCFPVCSHGQTGRENTPLMSRSCLVDHRRIIDNAARRRHHQRAILRDPHQQATERDGDPTIPAQLIIGDPFFADDGHGIAETRCPPPTVRFAPWESGGPSGWVAGVDSRGPGTILRRGLHIPPATRNRCAVDAADDGRPVGRRRTGLGFGCTRLAGYVAATPELGQR